MNPPIITKCCNRGEKKSSYDNIYFPRFSAPDVHSYSPEFSFLINFIGLIILKFDRYKIVILYDDIQYTKYILKPTFFFNKFHWTYNLNFV